MVERVPRTDLDGGVWGHREDGFGLSRGVHRPAGRRVRFDDDAFARRTRRRLVDVSPEGVEAVARKTRYLRDGDTGLHELAPEAMTTWNWEPDARRPLARERDGAWCPVAPAHQTPPYGRQIGRAHV